MAGKSTPQAGGNRGGWHSCRFAHTFAAIDLGTNNFRLLVAPAPVDGYEVIDAYSQPFRLGEGVALNGSLCGEAIERHRISRARHVATKARRRACNSGDFLTLASCENLLDPRSPSACWSISAAARR